MEHSYLPVWLSTCQSGEGGFSECQQISRKRKRHEQTEPMPLLSTSSIEFDEASRLLEILSGSDSMQCVDLVQWLAQVLHQYPMLITKQSTTTWCMPLHIAARFHPTNERLVRLLLSKDKKNEVILYENIFGETPVHIATASGAPKDIIELLATNRPSTSTTDERTADGCLQPLTLSLLRRFEHGRESRVSQFRQLSPELTERKPFPFVSAILGSSHCNDGVKVGYLDTQLLHHSISEYAKLLSQAKYISTLELEVLVHAVDFMPEELHATSEIGRYPLHNVCQLLSNKRKEDVSDDASRLYIEVVRKIISASPTVCSLPDDDGVLPVHHLIRSLPHIQTSRYDIFEAALKALFKVSPDSYTIPDPKTGFPPFLLAAHRNASVGRIYQLLRNRSQCLIK